MMGANAYYYLKPIGRSDHVSRLWIVRTQEVKRGDIPKAEYKFVVGKPLIWRLLQMLWTTLRLGQPDKVRAFTSFNPIPYGLVQLPAAKLFRKPIHFGFVGSDWYRHAMGRSGRLLRPLLKLADFYTCTGPKMRRQMIEYGLDVKRIAILPHSIDLENYSLNDPDKAEYTCVFVGYLIKRKRVDLILQAMFEVRSTHPDARLCIVGDGPLYNKLKYRAAELGITAAVDFVGFAENVQPYLVKSKICILASDMEGLPFAMIEGMSCGLVPVSTPVGTIEDLIVDGENGLLFPLDDAHALAGCINRLIEDPDLYGRLRTNVLELRDRFSFEAATAVWDSWFSNL